MRPVELWDLTFGIEKKKLRVYLKCKCGELHRVFHITHCPGGYSYDYITCHGEEYRFNYEYVGYNPNR
jgi:hypothetical protein